jgi:hypothetical protein
VSISKAIKPNDEGFRAVLRSGVTSVLLAPETGGLVSGNAALIKLTGDRTKDMIVKEYAAVNTKSIKTTVKTKAKVKNRMKKMPSRSRNAHGAIQTLN